MDIPHFGQEQAGATYSSLLAVCFVLVFQMLQGTPGLNYLCIAIKKVKGKVR